MKNKSAKAVGILFHPLTLGALALYALNLFVLQPLVPSWLTGKLGDFAWLFFFPYILTAISTLFVPDEWENGSFAAAVLLTGAGFVLAKATAFNPWLVGLLQGALRQPLSIVQDPTDLLALLALPGTIWLWRRSRPAPGSARRSVLLLVPLVMVLMLADSAAPNYGVTYLEAQGNSILACSRYNVYGSYRSTDGGLSWTGDSYEAAIGECANQLEGNGSIVDPTNGSIVYRYAAYTIQRSSDGGRTWKVEYSWRPLGQADQVYDQTIHQNYGPYSGSPTFAVADPGTGNIIFAMGTQGVLVRQAGTQQYSWVPVGPYHEIKFDRLELIVNLIFGEGILALIAGGLGITLLGLAVRKDKAKAVFAWLGVAGWLAIVWIFPPAQFFSSHYGSVFPAMGLFLVGWDALVLAVTTFFQAGARHRALLWKFALAFLGLAILFYVPYVLWALNVLPDYFFAAGAGTILTVGLLIVLWILMPQWLPSKEATPPG
jgi:hypothetical protein